MAYDPAGYEAQRRNIDYDYSRQAATNAYGRFLGQQRGSRQRSDLTQQNRRTVPRLNASFGARGLQGNGVQSGVQRQSMRNYLGDYYAGLGRLEQDQAQEGQQYDLQQQMLDQWRQQSMSDLALGQAQEIANTAANIKALQSLLGGL